MINNLADAIKERFACDPKATEFLSEILSEASVYVFGGAVRDYLNKTFDTARDVDLVIESNNSNKVDIGYYLDYLNIVSFKKNRFNGYKVFFGNLVVDIWNLQDTWAFQNTYLESSPENLMKSVYLNVDALVYSLNSNTYLENCNDLYSKINVLDIVFDQTPYEELNLLRALVFKDRYSLNVSQILRDKINELLKGSKTSYKLLKDLQNQHYNQILLDDKKLNEIYSRL